MDRCAVLLATYNGTTYIEDMLDSIEAQSRQDFKCYIHDDGSIDGTLEYLREWTADKSNYELMEFDSKRGAKNNFLEMLRRVEADYYMFADQDDVWMSGKVETELGRIEELTRGREDIPTVLHSDMYVTDDKLRITSESFIKSLGRDIHRNSLGQLLIDNTASGTTMIINRALRDRALEYNDIDDIPMHDHWIMVVAAACGTIHVVDEPLVYYRQHEDNVMGAHSEDKLGKVLRNGKDIVSGKFAMEKKRFHDGEKALARQLMYVSGIDNKTRKFLIDLIRIDEQSKIRRMRFYRNNDMGRVHHSLWMRLWV